MVCSGLVDPPQSFPLPHRFALSVYGEGVMVRNYRATLLVFGEGVMVLITVFASWSTESKSWYGITVVTLLVYEAEVMVRGHPHK